MPKSWDAMSPTAQNPGAYHAAVTPHDSTNLAQVARALYIGGAGDVVIVTEDDTAVTYAGALAGSLLPIATKRVNSTSTTATNIVAIW